MGRFSHSKLETFKQCPKRYDYNYAQDLNPIEESPNLTVGKLFHGVLEALENFEDPKPFYDEFAILVRKGLVNGCNEDTLKITVEEYLRHYNKIDADNETLYVEEKFEHLTKDSNVISGIIDKVYRRHDKVYVQDHKTTLNKLKYSIRDVTVHGQLNFYSHVLDYDYDMPNDFLEIDEICIRPLNGVELNKDGTPTTDTRKLAWTTYEDYFDVLQTLGLEDDPKYENILKLLKTRGHPLFRRTTVPVNELTRTNVYNEYISLADTVENVEPYRVKGPLCDYCPYQEMCYLELQGGHDVIVDNMKDSFFKKSE